MDAADLKLEFDKQVKDRENAMSKTDEMSDLIKVIKDLGKRLVFAIFIMCAIIFLYNYYYEKYNIEPDVITLAKGLGAGVPIGAILAKDEFSVFVPGDHGSTFGGNALTCAAAYASTKYILENDIHNEVNEIGSYFMDKLNNLISEYEIINEIRGMGLLIAMEFSTDIAADIVSHSNEEGILVNAVRPNAIRFMPPLTVSKSEIDEAIIKIKNAIEKAIS